MADKSFSIQPASLLDFANELQTQFDGIAAPMNATAAQAATEPQFGGFAEAQTLAAAQQSALQEMQDLLGQVKRAIEFTQSVTTAVAHDYRQADQEAAASMGYGVPGAAPPAAAGGRHSAGRHSGGRHSAGRHSGGNQPSAH